MTTPIGKISNGLIDSITSIMTTKEGLSIFFLVLTIFFFTLWTTGVLKKEGCALTTISFIVTIFMFWITWVTCECDSDS